MHLETLKIFCDLAELMSFSKTAEKHMLSQSAVSQQLAQLELAYKCQLINRKKRPIVLTKEGNLLYQTARDILERYEKFRYELSSFKTITDKRINLAAIYSVGMHALPRYVKKFMVRYPDVHVHVEYLGAAKIYDLVLSGDIDIGLVAVPRMDKRLDVFEFENESLVLVCSPKHPFTKEEAIDIHQLQFEQLIGFSEDVPTRIWIDGILQRYNMVLCPSLEFDNIETVKRAVEINSGISILPEIAIEQELTAGTLKTIPFSNEKFFRPTGIIVRRDRRLKETTKSFVDLLRKQIV